MTLTTCVGPIVRITPNQINIQDLEYYEEIYGPANRKRDRIPGFEWSSGAPHSAFSTVSHELHRRRRAALNPFFSKRAVVQLDELVQSKSAELCKRLQDVIGKRGHDIIRFDTAFGALTTDIITEYAFGKSWNNMSHPDFNQEWKNVISKSFVTLLTFKSFPLVARTMDALPDWIIKKLDPTLGGYLDLVADVAKQVCRILDETPGVNSQEKTNTIFHDLRDSDLPKEEKTVRRLVSEGVTIVAAGTEVTARATSLTVYHLLKDRQILDKLRTELAPVYAGNRPVPLSELEHLPYLNAVLLEGIRIAGGQSFPQSRVARDEDLKYKDWIIPRGTIISEIPNLLLLDPGYFPEPDSFQPERWLKMTAEERLLRSKIQFSTGPRNVSVKFALTFVHERALFNSHWAYFYISV